MTNKTQITLPPGTYFVGDPCYYVRGQNWGAFCDALHSQEKETGRSRQNIYDISLNPNSETPTRIIAMSTQYGDGYYPGSCGNSYSVDSGLLAIIPADSKDIFDKYTGIAHKFSEPVTISRTKEGTLNFGKISINTNL